MKENEINNLVNELNEAQNHGMQIKIKYEELQN